MRVLLAVLVVLMVVSGVWAQPVTDVAADAPSVVVQEALAIDSLARGGRSLIVTDPIEAMLVRGTWSRPAEGDEVSAADGRTAAWRRITASDDGEFVGGPARGYVLVLVRSEADRIVMLEARGHRHVLVNGVRRGGDVYNLGLTALPIELREGENELLFRGARGRMRIELREPEAELFWLDRDVTKPDAIEPFGLDSYLAAPIVNATTDQLLGLRVDSSVTIDGVNEAFERSMLSGSGAVAPLGVRKMPGRFHTAMAEGDASIRVGLVAQAGDRAASRDEPVSVKQSNQKHSTTFVSEIDGSVQYYAVTPPPDGERSEGLILTLHGASVEARNQANAYGQKDWALIVAPTNRRPFGFDWEDWGRIDALEVLEHASTRYGQLDQARTYLTGHSMGGHGTWQVGAHFAPRFAAIGPSAGWRDFWSYGGAGTFDEDDAIGAVLNTANNASRTLLLERNYEDLGVYVLHGDADDNVPVSQARFMRERLGAFHTDFAYYEQPGAGHWWGNQCVDWPPMMRFFEERSIDLAPSRERLVTINPAISSEARLFTIHRQAGSMQPASVKVERDAAANSVRASTQNVLALRIEWAAYEGFDWDKPFVHTIDGQAFEYAMNPLADTAPMHVRRNSVDEPWQAAGSFDADLKGAHRDGPFKHAFDNRVAFVYATGGTPEENAWSLAKARYDAEVWQYRANGSVDVVPDTAFDVADPEHLDRNVIVYGCADSHRLWDALLGGCPVRVGRGEARVGDRVHEGGDIAAHFVYPRPGSDRALVGVVAGTGGVGRRLADPARYFISGVGYPDWLLTRPAVLDEGLAGVVGAGFFGSDWEVDWEQSGWR